ncbi:MAG: gliding motility-associated C-terminal domain-containing protein [Saprospiraceae bacterium]|nr:gliding motility-associated C-terminal domain-containing protein [Saprospiraceae bacterium]
MTVTNDLTGCTAIDTINVTETPATPPQFQAPPMACPNGNSTINLTNAGTCAQILWNTGATTPIIDILPNITYTVTVTEANGCTSVGDFLLPEYPMIPPIIATLTDICVGQETLSLQAAPPYPNYLWSTGATSQNITATDVGTYSLTVTDVHGCTATVEQVIEPAPMPAPSIAPVAPFCNGSSQTINVQGGPFYSYLWSTGAMTPTIQANASGTYTVTVTNQRQCKSTASVTVTTGTAPNASVAASPANCSGTATLVASGGGNYLWSTGETTPTITTTTSGNYAVTVTASNGCTATASGTASIGVAPSVQINGPTGLCQGSTADLAVPNGYASYLWSNGATTSNISVTQAGPYAVTVTNAQGCTATANFPVYFAPQPVAAITGPSSLCNGGSLATLVVVGNFAACVWTTGATVDAIPITQPGVYVVTVTNLQGCTATAQQVVTFGNSLAFDIVPTQAGCNGSATLTAGVGFSSYFWSNGATTPSITVTQAGPYAVTVSDASGCSGEASESVSFPVPPSVAINGPTAVCAGSPASLAASGSNIVSYLWSTGQTTASIPVTQSNTYFVVVTDANGCSATASQPFTVLAPPTVDINGPSSVCTGNSATFALSGNFAQATWDTPTGTSNAATITASQPGTYAVTVTDSNGCSAMDAQMLTVSASLSPAIASSLQPCAPAGTLHAGAGYANYLWSNGATAPSINVSQVGDYSVTVSDASGCMGTATESVSMPNLPQVAIQGSPSICAGGSTVFSISGNFPQVAWSSGQTTPSINVSQPGSYAVTATDANGCTTTASQSLTVGTSLSPAIASNLQPCAPAGTLHAGTGYANYLWSNGATTPSINVSQVGSYNVTVSDASGCTGTASEAVSMPTLPQVAIQGSPSICTGGSTVFAVSGNFPQVTWSNGQTTPTINVSQPGTYAVTATDANGCTATASQSLTIGSSLAPDIAAAMQPCLGTAMLNAGAGYATYLWSNGSTSPFITVAQANNYAVTVSDASGCTGTAIEAISFPALPQVQVNGPLAICAGGSATLSVSGAFAAVAWSNGQTSPSINIAQAGNYAVTVTDANGCTATDSQPLAVNPAPTPDILPSNLGCDGTGTLMAGGGFASYLWSNGATTSSINIAQAGSYTLTVTNTQGCTGQGQITVSFPASPTVGVTGSSQLCEGYSEILSVQGSFTNYLWSTGATTPSITINAGGSYSVTVTASNGCTDEAEWNVTELPTQYSYFENYSCDIANVGTAAVTLTSLSGCDSVVTIATLLNPAFIGSLSLSACPGETAAYNGNQILAGTTQEFLLTSTSGCDSILAVTVMELPAVHLEWEATPSCWNGSNGTVSLEGTEGTSPYRYAIDNGSLKSSPYFVGLSAGEYAVMVQDGNGCKMEMDVLVPATQPMVVVLQDAALPCGEGSIMLEPTVYSGDEQAIAWRWSNGMTTKQVHVTNPGMYHLTADDGCEEKDYQAMVLPDADWDRGYFYVPNSFSPDGNAINDHFMAKVAADVEVKKFEFMVFDRWGNSMYNTYDPTSIGWDGLHREVNMRPAVFVWFLKAIVVDCKGEDKEIFMEGGVTVMR